MTTIQFCTIELSEFDSTGDGTDDIIDGILNPKPKATSEQKVPKDAYLVQYFTSEDNSTPISSRVEQQIQHDFSAIVSDDYKSSEIGARWIGDFNFKNEEYTFDILSDKSINLYIDGERIYEDDLSSGRKGKGKKLMKGKHRIVVEYNLTDSTAVDPIETTTPDPEDSIILIVPVIDSVALNEPIVEEEAETPTVEVDWTPTDSVTVDEPTLSQSTDILTFTLPEQTGDAIINTDSHSVTIEVAENAELTSLKPTFTLSQGATSDPPSATAGDYSKAVTITVTAEDGTTTQVWTVNVSAAKSTETDILSFTLPQQTGAAAISSDSHTVAIEVASGTDLTNLSPTYTLSDGATVPSAANLSDFSSPVTITVTAEDGVTTQDWIINVSVAQQVSECITNGGLAGDSGLKTWCWTDIKAPVTDGSNGYLYKKELVIDNSYRWYEGQITNVGDQLKFHLDPFTPTVDNKSGTNFRTEFRTAPWAVRHPKGTEEWFGWSYTFGDDYVIDQLNEWLFWQVHPDQEGVSPHAALMIINKNQYYGHDAGELYVINHGNYPDNHPTGITPKAGDKLDIVVHAIWGDASNGHLQVWINGVSVYDKQVPTVYEEYPWAGNAKWGIYKWPFRNEDRAQDSIDQGITHLDTYMGPLRMITRYLGDPDYGKDSYSLVAPR